MHQLGLTTTDLAAIVHETLDGALARLETAERAALNAGRSPEQAKQLALVQLFLESSERLLEANNRKVAADLIRLGVLTGTITRDGEPAF
ncbi:MAG TPA: hypothetical protein V6D47_03170 [Oscillatoriaceae cyanobacterium]